MGEWCGFLYQWDIDIAPKALLGVEPRGEFRGVGYCAREYRFVSYRLGERLGGQTVCHPKRGFFSFKPISKKCCFNRYEGEFLVTE